MRVPSVSLICGILAAVAAGFLFNNQFQHTNPRIDGVIEGVVFAVGFFIAALATGGR